ncbi:hypothetical protein [Thiocapsa marina]|uniref:hypothetical protein n=1 Tax=Thiocapsa marina TaxID=244573 RepID=UPI0002E4E530|nr:hypothetical protein [Thiocapsa marina]
MVKTETDELRAKTLFVKEPANMKLLLLDKLLTGFDASHRSLHRQIHAGPWPVSGLDRIEQMPASSG